MGEGEGLKSVKYAKTCLKLLAGRMVNFVVDIYEGPSVTLGYVNKEVY